MINKEVLYMGIFSWIIVGALAGWIASKITGNDASNEHYRKKRSKWIQPLQHFSCNFRFSNIIIYY